MWKLTFCPGFKVFSAVFFIAIIQIVVYIIELAHTKSSGLKALNENFFLGPQLWTLQEMGMRMPY